MIYCVKCVRYKIDCKITTFSSHARTHIHEKCVKIDTLIVSVDLMEYKLTNSE